MIRLKSTNLLAFYSWKNTFLAFVWQNQQFANVSAVLWKFVINKLICKLKIICLIFKESFPLFAPKSQTNVPTKLQAAFPLTNIGHKGLPEWLFHYWSLFHSVILQRNPSGIMESSLQLLFTIHWPLTLNRNQLWVKPHKLHIDSQQLKHMQNSHFNAMVRSEGLQ